MHLREIDWRIEPLHDVIAGIGAGLAAIQKRMDDEEGFDGLSAHEHAELLLGLGFVAAQIYAIGTVSDLSQILATRGKSKRGKLDCYACDSVALKGGVTRIQLVNAVANYFKHHDQWSRWPTSKKDRGFHDSEVLERVGITGKTEFPCAEATNLLCGTNWELTMLRQILKEWRAHVIKRLL